MNIDIRRENIEDSNDVYNLVKEAFKGADHADGDEHNLVNRLKKSDCFIPELSLVATINKMIVGYIMFTKLLIKDGDISHESLALAPLAILPKYQKLGIGSRLINSGIEVAKKLGYKSIIVLGSEEYYPRFGFEEAIKFNIKPPFDVPSENFMVMEISKNSLENVKGDIIYAKEFFEEC